MKADRKSPSKSVPAPAPKLTPAPALVPAPPPLPPAADAGAARPDIESVLRGMLAKAQAAGESFLDVTAKDLCTAVNDPTFGSGGVDKCGRVMKRMMIPGDYDLSSLSGPHRTRLLIRFRLPR